MKKKALFIALACLLATVWIASVSLAATSRNTRDSHHSKKCDSKHHKDKHHGNKHHCDKDHEECITVLNPLGTRQPFEVFAMADRPDTLADKKVYIVCVGFCYPLHTVLPAELEKAYPDTTWITVNKYGTYFQDDPDLWNEIKANGAGAILHTGH